MQQLFALIMQSRILRLWLVLSAAWITFVLWHDDGFYRVSNDLPCAVAPASKTCFPGFTNDPVPVFVEHDWTVNDLEELLIKAFGPPIAALGLLLGLSWALRT